MCKVKLGVIALSAVAVFAFAFSPSTARADEITLAGTTSGIFTGSGTNILNGMAFTGGTFNGVTSGGMAALNLGSFYLNPVTNIGYSGNFILDVTFTNPTGISGSNSTSYTAQVQGNVSLGTGGVWVFNFLPPSYTFSFSNALQTGSFSLSVNSLSVSPGATVPLTGFVNATATSSVSEPPTIFLSGIGLVGIFLLKRRLSIA